jgi:hypothetical protein
LKCEEVEKQSAEDDKEEESHEAGDKLDVTCCTSSERNVK